MHLTDIAELPYDPCEHLTGRLTRVSSGDNRRPDVGPRIAGPRMMSDLTAAPVWIP
ncbi:MULTISPECIES: hypothetical protein [unclassified Frankia]|uniref:hypothetical protein n=1 Tax=unclassified Frankia TaxID=2632575 RepID=UPI0012FF245F|nr:MULTISPECIES: hypothetical protein [unclassified Frankia]